MTARDLIIDAGANRGEFSLTLADRNPLLTVLAIEPEPQLAAGLKSLSAARGLTNHITIQTAIALEEGQARFFVSHVGDWGTSSLLSFDADHIAKDEYWATRPDLRHTMELSVSTRRLESVLDEIEYHRIAFLKIDTQGLDIEVLTSLGRHLPRLDAGMLEVVGAPCRSLYENAQDTMLNALRFLSEYGFEPYAVKPNDPAANEFNVFFSRADMDYHAVEEALSLRRVPMYDGKHFWMVPGPVLHDPLAQLQTEQDAAAQAMFELDKVRADAAEVAALLDSERVRSEQLNNELTDVNAAAAEEAALLRIERDGARGDGAAWQARSDQHLARIERLQRLLDAAMARVDAAQQRHDIVLERYDVAQARVETLQLALLEQAKMVERRDHSLAKSLEANGDYVDRLARAVARLRQLSTENASIRHEAKHLRLVEAHSKILADELQRSHAERERLTRRLSYIESRKVFRAMRWAFRQPASEPAADASPSEPYHQKLPSTSPERP